MLQDGEGPQEVRSFGNVIRLAGDTLAAVMPGNAAYQLISGGGSPSCTPTPTGWSGSTRTDSGTEEANDPGGVLFAPDGQLLVPRTQLGVSDSTRDEVDLQYLRRIPVN